MIRKQGGKIVEEWRSADRFVLMQQLGVIPAPQQA
jgi:predicted ester cyclase